MILGEVQRGEIQGARDYRRKRSGQGKYGSPFVRGFRYRFKDSHVGAEVVPRSGIAPRSSDNDLDFRGPNTDPPPYTQREPRVSLTGRVGQLLSESSLSAWSPE